MSKLKILDKRSEISIMSERNLLSTLNHSFIVNMYFAFQDFYNLYLVMDLLTGGDLRYHIALKRTFSESETRFFISNMIIALEYIHSKNIIHRDIKPENLVLESTGYLRITDFGVAKINESDNSSETSGTPGYMAPEVILVLNHSFPSDFFALGVIGYEFMLGYRPYLGRSRKEIKELIINKQAKIKKEDLPENWSEESMDFINKLLKRKAEKRLGYNGIDELKNHSWMNNIDWEQLEMKKIKPPFIPNKKENYDKNYCEEEDEIGEETIERYQLYAQNDLYPDVFKNYTFCNLSYISNYHIKRLKRFKENNIKIKDIVEQNVNKVLNEEKDFFKLKKLEKLENEKLNHNNFFINKNHSKSVEDFNQYNIDKLNKEKDKDKDKEKEKDINLNNKEINDESKTIKSEIKNEKQNKNKEKDIDKESKNNIEITNNQLNNDNTNSNYYTIETNKTNSKNKKKQSNQKSKLSKYKRNKEYIKNYKENIVYNNYINLHFNNFLNNRNFNYNNIYESSLSKKKNIKCKAYSNITNKTKSKFNSIKNTNIKNKKNTISKSGSEKILDNNKNMANQFLSPNKDKCIHDKNNNKVVKAKKPEFKTINIENKNGIKLNKNPKKLDFKYFLYNKKYDLLLDILNSNEKKTINSKENSKKKEITKSGNRIGKSYSSCGFYSNEKILTTQRKKKNNSKLSKLKRNLSMYNISNNYNIIQNNINYKTLNAQSNYFKKNSKKKEGKNKNKKYNVFSSFSSSINSSKSISNRKSKKFYKDNNNKNKNSPDFMKNQKLIKFLDEYNLINKRNINNKKSRYKGKTYKSP